MRRAMSNMLETWVVLHAWLLLLLHHLVTVRCTSHVPSVLLSALVILVVVSAAFIREVLRAFVFVRSAILLRVSFQPCLSPRLVVRTYWNLAIVSLMSPEEYS